MQLLPPPYDLETKQVLKAVIAAQRVLGQLNCILNTLPGKHILLNNLSLQEAQSSSEIENIVTTQDELYQGQLEMFKPTGAVKEVLNYSKALITGHQMVQTAEFLSENHILQLHDILMLNNAGYRKQAGTVIKNDATGEIVHSPPQTYDEIVVLMTNLLQYLNTTTEVEPLVKMAVVHLQFEKIHPFYDGNGRLGRIINLLCLTLYRLLDYPVLYLSRYIIENKTLYYTLLRQVNDNADSESWQNWVLYMVTAVEQTAIQTITLIQNIQDCMQHFKTEMQNLQLNFYSKDLLESLFRQPYITKETLMLDLNIHYHTATDYLNKLTQHGFLERQTRNRTHYYLNLRLVPVLQGAGRSRIL